MARTKKQIQTRQNGLLSQIKWGESYTSLFLGAVVVVVALVLVFSFLRGRNDQTQQTTSTSVTAEEQVVNGKIVPKVYTVKEGEDLWHIAQGLYGSGYNWVDLAQENKLTDPNYISVGAKLTVPNVKPKELTTDEVVATQPASIKATSYTVVTGDYLWDIAVRAYGDGFKWVEISKANSLTNPDLIYPGDVLKLPR
ncbi:MAG: LysM peptidoglycan-binding domain-containing protein [Candidatus Levybacteria bacterium]|nr:LysM peptidoglycan-binding domain-containing protein [Candidatus Levybacteria bacterium]